MPLHKVRARLEDADLSWKVVHLVPNYLQGPNFKHFPRQVMSCKGKIKELLHVVWHSFTNPKNSGAISILSYPEQVFTNLAHKCKPHTKNPSPLTRSMSIPLIVSNAYMR